MILKWAKIGEKILFEEKSRHTKHWLKALTHESFNDFLIPKSSAPLVMEKFPNEKRIFPDGEKRLVTSTKIQIEMCGKILIFRLEKI